MKIESTGPGPRMDAGFFVGHKRRMDMQMMAGYSHQRCSMIHLHPACRYPFTFYGSCCIIFKSAELNAGRRRMKKWNS